LYYFRRGQGFGGSRGTGCQSCQERSRDEVVVGRQAVTLTAHRSVNLCEHPPFPISSGAPNSKQSFCTSAGWLNTTRVHLAKQRQLLDASCQARPRSSSARSDGATSALPPSQRIPAPQARGPSVPGHATSMPDPGDKRPSVLALRGVGRCSADPSWVGTPSPKLSVLPGASAEMLVLCQGGWQGRWFLQGKAKGC